MRPNSTHKLVRFVGAALSEWLIRISAPFTVEITREPLAARAREEHGNHVERSARWCAPRREASDHQWRRRGLNSKIVSIKRNAGGFRNPSNFTTAIYFHCGASTYTHAKAERFHIISGFEIRFPRQRIYITRALLPSVTTSTP